MKRSFLRLFSLLLIIAAFACNNETTAEKAAPAEPKQKAEPEKTEISVGPDGAAVKTKDGNEVKADKSGASVGTKDVKVKVSSKDTIR